ncbi:MAG: HPr family phosphocarrier protein [Eubacteriales bacterium]
MVSKTLTLGVKAGLHARPAGILCKAATGCTCSVKIQLNEKLIEVKSILNIMAAAIKCGTEFELQCDGENEEESLAMLCDLIENGLGE